MWYWWFLLACDLLIPLLMCICGRFMWKHPPKKINGDIGYRTKRSMKNEDTWKFAHNYCGRLWWKIGLIMLVPSVIAFVPFYNSSTDRIGLAGLILCSVQCVIMIVSIFPTEIALKRTFTDEGIKKDTIV